MSDLVLGVCCPAGPSAAAASDGDDDDLVIVEAPDLAQRQRDAKGKQKREADDDKAPRKRQRTLHESDDVIELN